MRVGLAPPNYARWFDGATVAEVCRHAEEAGFDSLWFGDHVAIPQDQADVFGNAYLDVFPLLGHVAALTERVRLGTNVLVAPYRNPVVTAKEVATVDRLSDGRVVLGVGVGHVRGEFEALGVPFDERGRRTDEYLRAMRALWEQDVASYEGEWVRFRDLCPLTRPVQQPLPVLIGGDGPRSMRRALEHDAGWAPGQGTIEQLAAKVAQLRTLAAEVGKPCPTIVARWLVHPVEDGAPRPPIPHRGELRRPRLEKAEAREQLARIAELGVSELIVDIPARHETYHRNIDLIAEHVLAG
ncbi:TIGR03619 family F420-dependent LLM class oxidoreductase [Mumia zhuanghuii]|uniref:TIGR03619 family F420-dependent LLM class oxidoreductase n=2 Tax=Mumia TaxID=1546255 RepID=A0ABW1QHN6_9ACTN|nr:MULTISPECIES: TIGR03619 family F420-dependent LLM class oxidoreductase [Mumia]KAA1423022.1 TIGR03619 family F420-dependent LLM class oxidoreductase [Mumia zhuanghuii]